MNVNSNLKDPPANKQQCTILEKVGEYLNTQSFQKSVQQEQYIIKDQQLDVNTFKGSESLVQTDVQTNLEQVNDVLLDDELNENDIKDFQINKTDEHKYFLDFSLLDEEREKNGSSNKEINQHYERDRPEMCNYLEHGQGQDLEPPVKPETRIFTSASPMVASQMSVTSTPYLTGDVVRTAQNTPYLQSDMNSMNIHPTKGKFFFSPLSSPALKENDSVRCGNFSLPEASMILRKSSTATRSKKTPHSTPHIDASTGKVVKHSPLMGPKKVSSPKIITSSWDNMLCLPSSSSNVQNTQSYQPSTPSTSKSSSVSLPSLANAEKHLSSDNKAKPAAVLNYAQYILPSNIGGGNSLPFNGMIIRATESAVIKPCKYSDNVNISDADAAVQQNYIQPVHADARYTKTPTISKKCSNKQLPGDSTSNDDGTKKEFHKVAEQGRRKRLNNALVELNALIPAELKNSTQIPSKATTVELACKYIKQLTSRLS